MIKTAKYFSLLTALVWMTSTAVATELKVGWINIERIFREAAPAQMATKKLEKEFDKRQVDLQKVGKQMQEEQADLDKNGMTLSEADRSRKERDLANLNRDFQRMQREFREDLNTRRNEEFASIQERANKTIKEIAESEKYDLILTDAIYAGPRIDITDKVLKALDASSK
ncbi:MAG: OmpH family outer membrane protein [Ferrovum sp.]|nr:OmpH family outer membrane protein [Ferrovum sp.]NDU86929.1 OmpH family outer membrane protein [Ferrovum sp.]